MRRFRYITNKIDTDLYAEWLKFLRITKGVQSAGRYSTVGDINTKLFEDAIREKMGKKKK